MLKRARTQGQMTTPVLATGSMMKIGQWRKVMSVVFKMLRLEYLWAIQVVRSSSQLEIQTGALGRGEYINELVRLFIFAANPV